MEIVVYKGSRKLYYLIKSIPSLSQPTEQAEKEKVAWLSSSVA